jgi:hypothetical protein
MVPAEILERVPLRTVPGAKPSRFSRISIA